jgi:hypothetical protein
MSASNGISRVVFIYRPESLSGALKDFEQTLGINDFEGPYTSEEFGLSVAVSWSAGIELVAPTQKGTYSDALWAYLNERGEGMFSLVYRVRNLQEAEARAIQNGHPRIGDYIDGLAVEQSWRKRFSMLKEAIIEPVGEIPVTLIQIEQNEG